MPLNAIGTIWSAERGLTPLFALVFVTIFVLHPLGDYYPIVRLVTPIVALLITVIGIMTVLRTAAVRAAALVFVACVGAYRLLHPSSVVGVMLDALLSALFCGLFVLLLLRRIFQVGPITAHRVVGAITVYLLLGMAWMFVYYAIELAQPGSFTVPIPGADAGGMPSRLLYFSFTTLTTVGYGDIVPIGALARSASNLEGLVGQLFPAVLLAHLVSMEVYFHQKKFDESGR